ncbi:hypothetical protein [Streptomyces sp. NBC_01276]
MIPSEHRLKGGAPLLGAAPGPFDTWTEDDDPAPEQDDDLRC